MENLFETVLRLSLTAMSVILLILLVRLALRRAPKVFSYALWAVVLFRLLCPFAIESAFSLLPAVQVVPAAGQGEGTAQVFRIQTMFGAVDRQVNDFFVEHAYQGQPALPEDTVTVPAPPVNQPGPEPDWRTVPAAVWLAGTALLLGYGAVSLLLLRRRLAGSMPLEGERDVRLADHIPSPFVLGLFRPKIYLPSGLPEGERDYILLHERTHIRRCDHIFRALAWLALAVHWFNPLVWLAFHLAGKDMEMSCDEAVLRKMGRDVRADYSSSLLRLSTGKRLPAGPLAFGDGDPKSRIKNVLRYQKPALWVMVIALIAVVCAGVALATDRGAAEDPAGPAARVPGPAELWFDETSRPFRQEDMKAQLPEFPGVTFTLPGLVMAVTEDGGQELIRGSPILNVYFCDLNGDGKRELCATVSYGSGIVDHHVVVYDYANQASYELWDRGVYDYSLRLEGDQLWAEEREYPFWDEAVLLRAGPLVMTGSGLDIRQQIPVDDLTADLTFSLDTTGEEHSVKIEGSVDDVALPRGAFWSPPHLFPEHPYGWLSMVYPAFTDGIEGHVTAGWTDESRTSVLLSTRMTAMFSSQFNAGWWEFTVDLGSGAVTEMTAQADPADKVYLYPESISDEEAVKAARVAAKLLTAAEDYYNDVSARFDPEEVWMEAVPGTVTPTGLTYMIHNETQDELMYGNPYGLQVEDGGIWRGVDTENQMDFTLEGYILRGKASASKTIDWSYGYGELPPGHYRITTEIRMEPKREPVTLSAEFEIEG